MSFLKKYRWWISILCVLAAVALTVFFCLHGRESVQTPDSSIADSLKQPFSASASIHTGDISAVADVNRTAPDQFTFTFQEPAQLNGLTFDYKGDMLGISYRGMSVNTSQDSLLAKGICAVIMRAINSASEQTGIQMEKQDGILSLNGSFDQRDFTVQLDESTGALLQVSIPELDLKCSFSNVSAAQ